MWYFSVLQMRVRRTALKASFSVQELVNTAGEDLADRTELAWWPRCFSFCNTLQALNFVNRIMITYDNNNDILIVFNGDDM